MHRSRIGPSPTPQRTMVDRRKGDHGQQAGRHYWHHHSQLTKSEYAVLMYTTDLHPKPQGSDRASPQLHWGQLPPARGNATSVTESASPKPRGWEKADGAAQGQSAGCAGGRKGHNWSYPSVVGRWSESESIPRPAPLGGGGSSVDGRGTLSLQSYPRSCRCSTP